MLKPQGDLRCEGYTVLHLQYPQDQIQFVGTCTDGGGVVVCGLQNVAAPEDLTGNTVTLPGDNLVAGSVGGFQPEHIGGVKGDFIFSTVNDELEIHPALFNTTAILCCYFVAQDSIKQETVGDGVKGADDVVKGVCIIAGFVVRIKGFRAGTDQLSGDGCRIHVLRNIFVGFHSEIDDIGKVTGQIIPDGTLVAVSGSGQL